MSNTSPSRALHVLRRRLTGSSTSVSPPAETQPNFYYNEMGLYDVTPAHHKNNPSIQNQLNTLNQRIYKNRAKKYYDNSFGMDDFDIECYRLENSAESWYYDD